MSWRTTQLNDSLCDQDRLILDLFKDKSVRYIGSDQEFSQHLNLLDQADKVVAIFDQIGWLSDLIGFVDQVIVDNKVKEFYLGINRYCICGNDTDIRFNGAGSEHLVEFLTHHLERYDYDILKSGYLDHDQGKYFNFIQPVTWIYGTNKNN